MRCPGQDRRYWKEDPVFDEPCPKCGHPVEFFRDESTRRCPKCGHRFRNPRTPFDCGQWCAYAEQCLGYVPDRPSAADPEKGVLAGRLIQAIKQEYAADQASLARALRMFRHANELSSKEGADPRIVLAAALLADVDRGKPASGSPPVEDRDDEAWVPTKAVHILDEIGFDEGTIACVSSVIRSYRQGKDTGTLELEVVSDARLLADLDAETLQGGNPGLQRILQGRLKTGAARASAKRLLGA